MFMQHIELYVEKYAVGNGKVVYLEYGDTIVIAIIFPKDSRYAELYGDKALGIGKNGFVSQLEIKEDDKMVYEHMYTYDTPNSLIHPEKLANTIEILSQLDLENPDENKLFIMEKIFLIPRS